MSKPVVDAHQPDVPCQGHHYFFNSLPLSMHLLQVVVTVAVLLLSCGQERYSTIRR